MNLKVGFPIAVLFSLLLSGIVVFVLTSNVNKEIPRNLNVICVLSLIYNIALCVLLFRWQRETHSIFRIENKSLYFKIRVVFSLFLVLWMIVLITTFLFVSISLVHVVLLLNILITFLVLFSLTVGRANQERQIAKLRAESERDGQLMSEEEAQQLFFDRNQRNENPTAPTPEASNRIAGDFVPSAPPPYEDLPPPYDNQRV
ncbi:hypothetical protein M3Y94_00058100 [Aphelenchoides besseyi]|nr:hypothetical protein M3Y94_00058100 [Aphelenchoides besseyi]KAI6237971.1 hypothetical protein M3Y95_00321600 [Aphelenchoides besseyi]